MVILLINVVLIIYNHVFVIQFLPATSIFSVIRIGVKITTDKWKSLLRERGGPFL